VIRNAVRVPGMKLEAGGSPVALGSTEPHEAWGIAGEPKPRANPDHGIENI